MILDVRQHLGLLCPGGRGGCGSLHSLCVQRELLINQDCLTKERFPTKSVSGREKLLPSKLVCSHELGLKGF